MKARVIQKKLMSRKKYILADGYFKKLEISLKNPLVWCREAKLVGKMFVHCALQKKLYGKTCNIIQVITLWLFPDALE